VLLRGGGANLTWRSPVVTVGFGFEAIGKGRSDARLSIEFAFSDSTY